MKSLSCIPILTVLALVIFALSMERTSYSSPQDGTYWDNYKQPDQYFVYAISEDSKHGVIGTFRAKSRDDYRVYNLETKKLIRTISAGKNDDIFSMLKSSLGKEFVNVFDQDSVEFEYKEVRYKFKHSPDKNYYMYQNEEKKNSMLILSSMDVAKYYNNVGLAMYKKKQTAQALEKFLEALEFNKDYERGIFNTACMYGLLKNADKTILYLKKLKALNTKAANKYLKLAGKEKDLDPVRKDPGFISFMNSL